jgi:formate hydrogenlyase subunit 3/multisubunit Na+/H+ antiporter MnhD subunit
VESWVLNGIILSALLSGFVPLLLKRFLRLSKIFSTTFLGLSGLAALLLGIRILLTGQALTLQYPIGILMVHWTFFVDGLSAFFLSVIGLIVFMVAMYLPRYIESYRALPYSLNVLYLFTGLFVAGMYSVVLAGDAFSFMFSWEAMSLASYFLVAYQHREADNRRAALMYLIMAHASGLLILIALGLFIKTGNSFYFSQLKGLALPPFSATLIFSLALLGFGMKAGLVPLHVWLPHAHPVAPSPISALMSGVMLKVAVYGFIRFVFDLLQGFHASWGMIIFVVGCVSALVGVLYALMQHDLKRLLAYHSVENLGIIFMALGLSVIFKGLGYPVISALGLMAALYHTLNHAVFKSLLFLGAGSLEMQTHEHDIEEMGGLIHHIPLVAFFFLIGCLSISALPPFNGFISEWLVYQTSLQVMALPNDLLRVLILVGAAMLALTGALAAACFVKVYGIVFLGKPRSRHARHASHEHSSFDGTKLAMGGLALLCVLLGVMPTVMLRVLNGVVLPLLGAGLPTGAMQHPLWLMPLPTSGGTYYPLVIIVIVFFILLAVYGGLKIFRRAKMPLTREPWDCGFGGLNARMQYSATAFAMPLRRVFQSCWKITEAFRRDIQKSHPDIKAHYELRVEDRVWYAFYEPLDSWLTKISRQVARMQGGNMRVYLAYMFITLLILLWVVA